MAYVENEIEVKKMYVRIKPTYYGGYSIGVYEDKNGKEVGHASSWAETLEAAHRLARYYKRFFKISDVIIEAAKSD